MRILFVSGELIGGDLCCRLKREGHNVRLFIADESRKKCLTGMVRHTSNWRRDLQWVGKDGLIVFDDVGYGKTQDILRKRGYRVVGGSEAGDRLEKDRSYGQQVMAECGLPVLESLTFPDAEAAIAFVREHPDRWVVKQNNHISSLNYVGSDPTGKDVLSILERYAAADVKPIDLQKRVDGVEIAVGRFFNGIDWIGPICVNLEHKRLCNGDVGPMTGEMGTLLWYDENEKGKLFQMILAKLKDYLVQANFHGYFDINCIVSQNEIYPLETTARFGCPTVQLQSEIHISPWGEFLEAVATGASYDLQYKKGYGVVVSVAVPPFPYVSSDLRFSMKGTDILFKEPLTSEEFERLHFEEVSVWNEGEDGEEQYYISGPNGYTLYVSGFGKTVQKAREQAYALIDKLIIPKMFYRTDIGLKFIEREQELLCTWGWTNSKIRSLWNSVTSFGRIG